MKNFFLCFCCVLSMTAIAAPASSNWTFHKPNKENPFLYDKDPSFKGTFTSAKKTPVMSALLEFEENAPEKETAAWINQRYLEGKAVVISQENLSKDSSFMIFQIHEGKENRRVLVYTKKKKDKTLLLSYEGPADVSRKDFKPIHASILELLKSL